MAAMCTRGGGRRREATAKAATNLADEKDAMGLLLELVAWRNPAWQASFISRNPFFKAPTHEI